MIGRRFFLWLFGAASVAAPTARADGYGAAFAAKGEFPFVMIHADACGKPAFLLRRHPGYGGRALSADVAHLDGSPVEFNSRPLCDSCGKSVELSSFNILENV